jgi:hypothetical protein
MKIRNIHRYVDVSDLNAPYDQIPFQGVDGLGGGSLGATSIFGLGGAPTPISGKTITGLNDDGTYTVQSGDYGTKIASAFTGDGNRFRELKSANPIVAARNDPKNTGFVIWPGDKLIIPASWFSSVPTPTTGPTTTGPTTTGPTTTGPTTTGPTTTGPTTTGPITTGPGPDPLPAPPGAQPDNTAGYVVGGILVASVVVGLLLFGTSGKRKGSSKRSSSRTVWLLTR